MPVKVDFLPVSWWGASPWRRAVLVILICIAVPMCVLGIVLTSQKTPWGVAVLAAGLILAWGLLIGSVLYLRGQRRSLGPLLLVGDYLLPLPRWANRKVFSVIFLLNAVVFGVNVLLLTHSTLAAVGAVGSLVWLAAVSFVLHSARWEIREHGIWYGLEPLPWSRFVAYRWEERGVVAFQSEFANWDFAPRISVPDRLHDQMDELLGRYLQQGEITRERKPEEVLA